MRKTLALLMAAFCCLTLLAAGCATQETVKKETPPSETAVITPPPPPPPPPAPPVKEQPIPAPTIKDTVTVVEEKVPVEDLAASRLFQTIYFEFDAFVLSDVARQNLTKNAEAVKKNPAMTLEIQGHCDERGSDAYNLALGEKRAKAAFNYLVTLGVPAKQLTVVSYGKERPADPGHDDAAWAKNRRVEFVVLK